jgi:hypothetical protein
MLDLAGHSPDLSLFVAGGDDVLFVCPSVREGSGWRGKPGLIYVVVHRSHGLWTHVYRVVQDSGAGRLAVFVEKVLERDQCATACNWARASFAGPGSRVASGVDDGPARGHRGRAAEAYALGT